jgi:V/A-type H+-transporting ATPase subunit G/H
VDIKELQELIEEEKTAEERVKKAKEEAQNIIRAAREKAESIDQATDADPSWENDRKFKQEDMMKRKQEMEQEDKQKIDRLQRTAQQNFHKAVEQVVKAIMGGEI